MRFIIDEDLPSSINDLLEKYNYEPIDIRDTSLKGKKDFEIAASAYAQKEKLCIVTGDFDFSDIRNYNPSKYFGIIVLSIPGNVSALFINNLFENFIKQPNIASKIPGNLAIVEPGRIRWRT